jgi:hypothetical protein
LEKGQEANNKQGDHQNTKVFVLYIVAEWGRLLEEVGPGIAIKMIAILIA